VAQSAGRASSHLITITCASVLAFVRWLDDVCEQARKTTSQESSADLAAAIVLRRGRISG